MKSIFIFRRDFRIFDNHGLIKCFEESDEVLLIFIFTPEQITKNKYFSSNSFQFLIESLEDLNDELKKYNAQIYFYFGENVEILDTIIDIPDDAVISEKSIEIHKITREKSRELGNDIRSSLLFFFTSLADADLLVGHNITFDLNMVYAEIMRCPELIKYIPLLEEKRKFCTMKETVAFCCIPLKNSNSYNRLKNLKKKTILNKNP